MNYLFYIISNRGDFFDWLNRLHQSYSGLIIPGTSLHSVHGGFGDMVFQCLHRPWFDVWYNTYEMRKRIMTHSTLDYRSIELSFLLKNNISYAWKPFGWADYTAMQLNLAHTMDMDTKVLFEKETVYTTCDFHFKPEVLHLLKFLLPKLVEPFLNEYDKGKDHFLFNTGIFPNSEINTTFQLVFRQLKNGIDNPFLFDICCLLLLAFVFLWKAEISQRRGLNKQQQDISMAMNVVKQYLLADLSRFKGVDKYAQMVNMSISSFKNNFGHTFGTPPHKFWDNERLSQAMEMLLTTDEAVKNIATTFGYGNVHDFDRAFKLKFNETPTGFRKKYLE